MAQLFFLVLAIVGLVGTTNFLFGGSEDPNSLGRGRWSFLALSVGIVGLLAFAVQALLTYR